MRVCVRIVRRTSPCGKFAYKFSHVEIVAPGADAGDATGAWVQALGGNSRLDGNSNTARTEANSNGLLAGIDHEFSGWQVGVLAGTGRTDVKQQALRAKSKIDNTHFGAYASHNWGGFGLRGGLAWSEHDIDSTRELAFAGYSDTLSARYDGRTRQAFIEAGYRFGGPEAGLEPYLQVARVEVDLKQINERGGAAALYGKVDDTGTTIATAGLRFDKGLKASFQQDSWLHVRGGVGYRHASGDRNPMAKLGFASGGDTFAVSGAPIADSAVAPSTNIRRPSDNVMSTRCAVTEPVEEVGKTGASGTGSMPAISTGRKVTPSGTDKSAA